ncbi:helix-turn-helix transcriptional regulator [Candidatus Marinimicrobia bacterium]|nr:helix-turn-helix transcriptional regulator [Candidatus Neomarinimicrobiota bacterium]
MDIFGDKWSLLIIRDMIFLQKKTFKEFFSSHEKIASNILSSRLKSLEKIGIISKNTSLKNKKIYIYKLTVSGLKLIPLFLEIIIWSKNNIKVFTNESQKTELKLILGLDKPLLSLKDKQKYIKNIEHRYLKSHKYII